MASGLSDNPYDDDHAVLDDDFLDDGGLSLKHYPDSHS